MWLTQSIREESKDRNLSSAEAGIMDEWLCAPWLAWLAFFTAQEH